MRTLVKICGLTREEDLAAAADAGADAVGLIIDVARSPRRLTVARATQLARVSPLPVVVLLDRPSPQTARAVADACRASVVQLVSDETPDEVEAIANALARLADPDRVDRDTSLAVAVGLPSPEASAWAAGLIAAGAQALLADTRVTEPSGRTTAGGTGVAVDLADAAELVAAATVPVWLAGGLTPDNVGAAIRAVRPYGVDVSGGVERDRGIKDPALMGAFVDAVRSADREIHGGSG